MKKIIYEAKQARVIWIISIICILNYSCTKRSRNVNELKNNVVQNETSFNKLVNYFSSVIPSGNYIVTFGVGDANKIHLTYYKNEGNIADSSNHFGGTDLELHSTNLDSAIKSLGWSYETISTLRTGLKDVKCEFIRNTDWFGNPINIYMEPSGFMNSDYNIYPLETLEAVKARFGEPIGQSAFLKRVYINTSSDL